jgi:hypothetical protein
METNGALPNGSAHAAVTVPSNSFDGNGKLIIRGYVILSIYCRLFRKFGILERIKSVICVDSACVSYYGCIGSVLTFLLDGMFLCCAVKTLCMRCRWTR